MTAVVCSCSHRSPDPVPEYRGRCPVGDGRAEPDIPALEHCAEDGDPVDPVDPAELVDDLPDIVGAQGVLVQYIPGAVRDRGTGAEHREVGVDVECGDLHTFSVRSRP